MELPRYWNSTLTVYSKQIQKTERTQISWVRSVYKNCFWGHENTQRQQSKLIARIPFVQGLNLKKGDIVAFGEIPDTLPAGASGSELLKKYDGCCFVVNECKSNTKVLPYHFFGGE